MSLFKWIAVAAAAAVVAAGLLVTVWRADSEVGASPSGTAFSPLHLLAVSEDDGFPRIRYPWNFRFPADHAGHHEYRTEWWHITGTLADRSRNRLGVQFLLVRIGLTPRPREHPSRWATSEVYGAWFSVSDPFEGRLRTDQRLSRAALGLAGAATEPIRIWVEDWRLEEVAIDNDALDSRMHVEGDDLELELALHNIRPLVDTTDIAGQSSDQAAPFQFYVQPRLRADGTLRIGERRTAVAGDVSMEHAWGELPLPGGPVARDRFTLYLDDGRVLFGVRTHRVSGSGTPQTTGLLIDRNDRPRLLSNADIELDPTDYWKSPSTGVRYPIRWTLRVPDPQIEVELVPSREDQEGFGWTPFWAGPVRVRGLSSGTAGEGFVLLNGYDGA